MEKGNCAKEEEDLDTARVTSSTVLNWATGIECT